METITQLMDRDHKILIRLLEKFLEEYNKEPIESGMILEKFKWAVEKHFSIEELAIFNTLQNVDSESVSSTFELMKEHQVIMALLSKIQNELGDQVEKDVNELEASLKAHAKFEDEVFYPQLEEQLNDNQKEMIRIKMKEKVEVK